MGRRYGRRLTPGPTSASRSIVRASSSWDFGPLRTRPWKEHLVYGGVAPVRRGVVDSVRLGPLAVDSVTAGFVLEGDRGETPLSERGANLGNGVLMHFVVGLDYPNGSVVMWQP